MPAIFRTSEVSSRRIDPWHYQPQFQTLRAAIRATGKAAELSGFVEPVRGVTGGATPLGAEYQSQGVVRFYRTTEIRNMGICHDEAVFINDDDDQDMARSRLAVGDVLLTITGANFGESAVVEAYQLPGNISQHSVRFGLAGLNPYFLVAYLNSSPGQSMIWQQAYGATRPAIDYPSVRELLVLNLSQRAQIYIGDKVRQAERLREIARTQLAASRHRVEQYFGNFVPQPISRAYRVAPDFIAPRIDAWFHNPRFLNAQEAILRTGAQLVPLSNLAACITNGGTPTGADFVANGIPWVRGKDFHDGDISFADVALMDRESEESIARSRLQVGDLVLSIKGTVGDVAVSDEEVQGANINQDIARVQVGDLTRAHFLALFLESSLGQTLIEQQVYGAINAFFSLENLRVFMVPDPDTIDDDFVCETAAQRRDAIQMRREVHRLTTAAKLLVEALVEGKVTEAELVNAQEALERGDNSADRALLQRLKHDGLDTPGQRPLFPDLDALYALLAQTQEAKP